MYTDQQLAKIKDTYTGMTDRELAEEALFQHSQVSSAASTEDDIERAEARLEILEEAIKRNRYTKRLSQMRADQLIGELEKLVYQTASLSVSNPLWHSSHDQIGLIRAELLARLNECPGCGEQITGGTSGLCLGCDIAAGN